MAKTGTKKQREFARLVASGDYSIVESYQQAGYTILSRAAQRVEACRLLSSETVSALVEQERAKLAKVRARIEKNQEAMVLSDSQRILDKLRIWLDGEAASTSQLKSAELLAKISGMLRTEVSIETKERDSETISLELEQKLAALLGPNYTDPPPDSDAETPKPDPVEIH